MRMVRLYSASVFQCSPSPCGGPVLRPWIAILNLIGWTLLAHLAAERYGEIPIRSYWDENRTCIVLASFVKHNLPLRRTVRRPTEKRGLTPGGTNVRLALASSNRRWI